MPCTTAVRGAVVSGASVRAQVLDQLDGPLENRAIAAHVGQNIAGAPAGSSLCRLDCFLCLAWRHTSDDIVVIVSGNPIFCHLALPATWR
jgi:hypothetical protein